MGTGRKRWPLSYRMIIKAEHTEQGSNVRFVVTNLAGDPQKLYDRCYVQRADACENSIRDLKRALRADRLSCHRFWANQFRLLPHAAAYVLMYMLRRAAHGTELADAQMDTLRLPAQDRCARARLRPSHLVSSGLQPSLAVTLGSHRQAAAIAAALRLNRPHSLRLLFPRRWAAALPSVAHCVGPSPKNRERVRERERERERERSGTRRRWPRDRQRCRLMNNPG